MMKKTYLAPELEISLFTTEDILAGESFVTDSDSNTPGYELPEIPL